MQIQIFSLEPNYIRHSFAIHSNRMDCTVRLFTILCFYLAKGNSMTLENLRIFRLGDDDNLGTGSDVYRNADDYILATPENAINQSLPRNFSFCFNLFYITMDYWSKSGKTIIKIFDKENDDEQGEFFLRFLNFPPRGTMVVNSGRAWSGGLGDFHYDDLPFQRWSSICMSLNFDENHIVYFIDGRKVADEKLVDKFKPIFKSSSKQWPKQVQMFRMGENIVGDLTNVNAYAKLLTPEEMHLITTCNLYIPGDYINWANVSLEAVGNFTKERLENKTLEDLCKPTEVRKELFNGKKELKEAIKFCNLLGDKLPIVEDLEEYNNLTELMKSNWMAYPKNKKKCKNQVMLPQQKSEDDTSPTPYIEPYNKSEVAFTNWAKSQPTQLCTDQGFYGLALNVNPTKKQDNGYYCFPQDRKKMCFVCESVSPLPKLFSFRGLCTTSQFNQKYALMQAPDGSHYYQGDSHANITFDKSLNTWVISSMVNKRKYQRFANNYVPSLTKAISNSSSYSSYFLGKQEVLIESDPTCSKESLNISKIILFSKCSEDEFVCEDGQCLNMEFRCNGVINCPNDNTDENDCSMVIMDETYKKDYAPVTYTAKNEMVKVDVNISIQIQSILLISEIESHIKLKLVLNVVWLEHRVEYSNLKNKSNHNTLTGTEKDILWIPTVIFANTEHREGVRNDEKAFLAIKKTGDYRREDIEVLANQFLYHGSQNPLKYSRPYTVELICLYNMQWYPFDTQNCTIELEAEGNSGLFIDLLSDELAYLGPKELSQYFVKGTSLHHDKERVWAEIILGRRLLSTILTVYVPTFLLNLISYATNFFKDFFFEAVVTVNLTAMLVLTTMFISVSTSLPTTSYIKMVDIWLIFNLLIPFFVVLLHTFMDTLRDDEEREVNHHGKAVEAASSEKDVDNKVDAWRNETKFKNLVSVNEKHQHKALR